MHKLKGRGGGLILSGGGGEVPGQDSLALEAAGRRPWCGGRRGRRWRPPECAGARSHLSCMMPSSAARPAGDAVRGST